MRARSVLCLPVLVLSLAPAARAADPLPPLRPTRDVAVTYRVEAAEKTGDRTAQTVRLLWGDHGEKLRAELGTQSIALVDFAAHRMEVLVPQQHMVLEAPISPGMVPGFIMPEGVIPRRTGTATVAGLTCTTYTLTGKDGAGSACITDDGVVLRAQGTAQGARGSLQAVSVTYGPQPATAFTVPQDYHRMDLNRPRR